MLPDLKQITKIVRWEFTWLNWFKKKKDAGVHIHHQKGIFSVQIFFLCVFNVHTVFDCILDENMGWSEQK